ncbi:hypothetical protein E8E12_009317 [Didymella heteroderae]|uniref:Uncharacterized protein n=1 Tax=Didymella heteroderae TaxID=1769908 RepID=A0A9P4WWZ1_9PLEO|nr:hypothetical protein E8E12_009317 [Didymella heteroderae]
MGETTLQDDGLAASSARPSTTYTGLKATALAFIAAQKHAAHLAAKMDLSALRRLTTPRFCHSFGPAYSVAHTPKLQGAFDFAAFEAHLQGMLPMLERWEIRVAGAVVDEACKSVVVRATYVMYVKGAQEAVENDVVWWLELEDVPSGSEAAGGAGTEGGWKVSKSTEIVDFGASAKIRELMMMTGEKR